jgi:alkylation response protein AidB-like acyl-CoA dehydrogenase
MEFIQGRLEGKVAFAFGLTEPNHGSDATHMSTHAAQTTRNGTEGWVVNGQKMWISGMHRATHCLVFARTHGKPGAAIGITAFFVPKNTPVRQTRLLAFFALVFLLLLCCLIHFQHIPKQQFTQFTQLYS